LDGDGEVPLVGLEDLEELITITSELSMEEGLAGLVEDADVETPRMQVDSAVMLVLLGVESHRGLLGQRVYPPRQPTVWVGRKGASNQYPGASSGRPVP